MSNLFNRHSASGLSALTCVWALFLIAAAFFARQVFNSMASVLGRGGVNAVIWICFLLLFGGLLYYLRSGRKVSALMPIIFIVGIAYAMTFDVAEERIHLVKYGILGILVACDNLSHGRRALFAVFCVGAAVACADETVQYALPYRVGDPRDVIFGILGSLWGGSMVIVENFQRSRRA